MRHGNERSRGTNLAVRNFQQEYVHTTNSTPSPSPVYQREVGAIVARLTDPLIA